MKIHELKLNTDYFSAVEAGRKRFEIRKNDRDYQVGDLLALSSFENGSYRRWASTMNHVGNDPVGIHEADTILMTVAYITDYEQKDGYVVMSIIPYSGTVND
ncbi:MAG: DUF3850 domain-containing protein [Enterococcus malodoratus]